MSENIIEVKGLKKYFDINAGIFKTKQLKVYHFKYIPSMNLPELPKGKEKKGGKEKGL